MAVDKALIDALEEKIILGEEGAFTRPYVILDVEEYRAVLDALKTKTRKTTKKVPRETIRA